MYFQAAGFLRILDEACGDEARKHIYVSKFERLHVHCAIASYHLSMACMAEAAPEKTDQLSKATSHLKEAVTIDIDDQLPVLGLGQVAQAKVGG